MTTLQPKYIFLTLGPSLMIVLAGVTFHIYLLGSDCIISTA